MIEIVIDSCSDKLTVLLLADGKLLERRTLAEMSRHSTALMPFVDEMIRARGFKISDADNFACVIGPGSFTGIRVGIATVKALCYALKKKAKAVTSTRAIAYNVSSKNCVGVADAKQNKFYAQVFDENGEGGEIKVHDSEGLTKLQAKLEGYTFVSNIAVEGCIFIEDITDGLIRAAAEAAEIEGSFITPEYIQKPQAERAL